MSGEDFRNVVSTLEEDNEDYRVKNFRDDLGNSPTYFLISSSKVDNQNSEVIANDYALERAYEVRKTNQEYEKKSARLNKGLAAAGVAGTLGSGWIMLETGDPSFLITGLASVAAWTYGSTNTALMYISEEFEEKSGEMLDGIGLDDYSITLSDSSEVDFIEESSSSGDVKAYTAEELEEMTDEDLFED